jgi:hypothetical protein
VNAKEIIDLVNSLNAKNKSTGKNTNCVPEIEKEGTIVVSAQGLYCTVSTRICTGSRLLQVILHGITSASIPRQWKKMATLFANFPAAAATTTAVELQPTRCLPIVLLKLSLPSLGGCVPATATRPLLLLLLLMLMIILTTKTESVSDE